jgi:hypothetical protein
MLSEHARTSVTTEGRNLMKPVHFLPTLVIFSMVISIGRGNSQAPTPETVTTASSSPQQSHLFSSSSNPTSDAEAGVVIVPKYPIVLPKSTTPFSRVGFAGRFGFAGSGFDIATILSSKFNLRAGSDFFAYSDTFAEDGANVAVNLRLRSGHAALDWFPFGGRFRMSPLVVFANGNQARGTALIPAGSTVTLGGQDYISSYTDPLHGSGSIGFRKVSPGFSLGFGNIIPRTRSHFSVPVEAGFFYNGQPRLNVAFTGSACDPTQPPAIGCQSVNSDADFQKSLAAFTARNNNNLKYASFFPILSVGLGFTF